MRRVSRSRVRRSLTVSVSSVLIVRRHRRVGRDLGARDCFLVPRLLVARLFSREESLSRRRHRRRAQRRGDDDGQHPHRQYHLRALCRYRSNPVRLHRRVQGQPPATPPGRCWRPPPRRFARERRGAPQPPNAVLHRATNRPPARPCQFDGSTVESFEVHGRAYEREELACGRADAGSARPPRFADSPHSPTVADADHRQRRAAGQFRARRQRQERHAIRPDARRRRRGPRRLRGSSAPNLAPSRPLPKTSAFSTVAAPSALPARYPASARDLRGQGPPPPPRRRFPFGERRRRRPNPAMAKTTRRTRRW